MDNFIIKVNQTIYSLIKWALKRACLHLKLKNIIMNAINDDLTSETTFVINTFIILQLEMLNLCIIYIKHT